MPGCGPSQTAESAGTGDKMSPRMGGRGQGVSLRQGRATLQALLTAALGAGAWPEGPHTHAQFQQQETISLAGEGMSEFPCPGTAAMDSRHIPVGPGPQRLQPYGQRALSRMQPGPQPGQAWAEGQQGRHLSAGTHCPRGRCESQGHGSGKPSHESTSCDHRQMSVVFTPLTPDSSAACPSNTHTRLRLYGREMQEEPHPQQGGETLATSRHWGAQDARET